MTEPKTENPNPSSSNNSASNGGGRYSNGAVDAGQEGSVVIGKNVASDLVIYAINSFGSWAGVEEAIEEVCSKGFVPSVIHVQAVLSRCLSSRMPEDYKERALELLRIVARHVVVPVGASRAVYGLKEYVGELKTARGYGHHEMIANITDPIMGRAIMVLESVVRAQNGLPGSKATPGTGSRKLEG